MNLLANKFDKLEKKLLRKFLSSDAKLIIKKLLCIVANIKIGSVKNVLQVMLTILQKKAKEPVNMFIIG